MASLIPALSEKAKQETRRIIKESGHIRTDFDGFQDLFDIEKYPITFEQMKDYCRNSPKLEERYADKEGIYYSINHTLSDGSKPFKSCLIPYSMTFNIKEFINLLSIVSGVDRFIIIGDIHGWWEKPQTY